MTRVDHDSKNHTSKNHTSKNETSKNDTIRINMGLSIYKSGQGYWTRMLSGIGGGTLVLSGVAWLLPKFDVFDNATIIQAIVGTSIIVVFGVLGWYLLNKPRVVDFMIATEAEMRKVNWPTRQEIIGSTWVVICGTVLMALLLFVIDVAFTYFFKSINILG